MKLTRIHVWSRVLKGLLLSTAALGMVTASIAADRHPATSVQGYAEIPDIERDSAIAFEPNGDAPALPAVAPVAPRVVRTVAVTVPIAPIAARPAPDQAPPLAVRVSFPQGRISAQAKADAVATMLRAHGMSVEEVGANRAFAAQARILFAFAEDHPAAAAIDRTLRAAYGLNSPTALAPVSMSVRRPGLIEIALPG